MTFYHHCTIMSSTTPPMQIFCTKAIHLCLLIFLSDYFQQTSLPGQSCKREQPIFSLFWKPRHWKDELVVRTIVIILFKRCNLHRWFVTTLQNDFDKTFCRVIKLQRSNFVDVIMIIFKISVSIQLPFNAISNSLEK